MTNVQQPNSNLLIKKVWERKGMLKTRGCVSEAECQNNKIMHK